MSWEKDLDDWYNNLDSDERNRLEEKFKKKMSSGYWSGWFPKLLWGSIILIIIAIFLISI